MVRDLVSRHPQTARYAVEAILIVVSVWAITGWLDHQNDVSEARLREQFRVEILMERDQIDEQRRQQINRVAAAGCKAGRDGILKFNDLLDDLIAAAAQARQRNLESGNLTRARDNAASILRYRRDMIHVPTDEECERPLLPKPGESRGNYP